MLIAPEYIRKSGVLEAPSEFPWKGKGQHFGPSEGTKVHAELKRLATCGIVTVTALTAEWLFHRLRGSIDSERYLHYIDATLAWEVDRRYRDEEPLERTTLQKSIPAHQALGDALWLIGLVANDDYQIECPESNVNSAPPLIHLTKHVLPPKAKKAFTEWFQWAVARAAELDPHVRDEMPSYKEFASQEEFFRAVRHYFGTPVPREALDPDSGFKPEERRARLSTFLQHLDHEKNPFLRSPQQMKELGFPGTPYELE